MTQSPSRQPSLVPQAIQLPSALEFEDHIPLLEPGLELGQDHIKEQALEQTHQSYLFS